MGELSVGSKDEISESAGGGGRVVKEGEEFERRSQKNRGRVMSR